MRIGILGAGNIAGIMAATLTRMEGVEKTAVASRDLGRAEDLRAQYGFKKAYGSYEELAQDKEVELIYIATPHSHHYMHIRLCLEHGKHVLCEKAFTVNEAQAAEVFALARRKGLLLTEAIWTRYVPMRGIIDEVLGSGVIGRPHMLTANLGYVISGKERISRPELAGGALLDVGVYTLNFAAMVFGTELESIRGSAVMNERGVDMQNSITLTYKDGRMAVLNSSAMGLSDRRGVIYGDKGYMEVENINNPQSITVYDLKRNMIRHIDAPGQISGYEYEVEESIRAIERGEVECAQMPHAESLRMMRWMDELRGQWGLKYPMEA